MGPVVDVARTPVPSRKPVPDEDGWLQCGRVACGQHFKPKKGEPTRFHCSDECAILGFYESHGMTPTFLLKAKSRKEIVAEADGGDVEKEAMRALKYGPVREIVAVIDDTRPRSNKVRLDCSHETSVPKAVQHRTRCRLCAREFREGESPVERQPVAMTDLTAAPPVADDAAAATNGDSHPTKGEPKAKAKKPVSAPAKAATAPAKAAVKPAQPAKPAPAAAKGGGVKYRKSDAPARDIVGWEKGRSANTRIAVLSCGHRSASDMSPRKHKRCMACLREGTTAASTGTKKPAPAPAAKPAAAAKTAVKPAAKEKKTAAKKKPLAKPAAKKPVAKSKKK